MSEQIRVVAIIEAKPGQEAALEVAALACIAPTREETGCIEYRLHRDSEDASRFVFIETWKSPAALDTHLGTPHLKAFLEVVQRTAKGDVVIHRLQELA